MYRFFLQVRATQCQKRWSGGLVSFFKKEFFLPFFSVAMARRALVYLSIRNRCARSSRLHSAPQMAGQLAQLYHLLFAHLRRCVGASPRVWVSSHASTAARPVPVLGVFGIIYYIYHTYIFDFCFAYMAKRGSDLLIKTCMVLLHIAILLVRHTQRGCARFESQPCFRCWCRCWPITCAPSSLCRKKL